MLKSSKIRLGAAAAIALLAVGGIASAQSGGSDGMETRVIKVPKGSVVMVLPPGVAVSHLTPNAAFRSAFDDDAFPLPMMPDPLTMIRQMNAQMNAMMARSRTIEAAMGSMPQTGDGVRGIMVTTISDGHGTCTKRVTDLGDGAAPKVEISATGGASCGGLAPSPMTTRPASAPEVTSPVPAPRTWRVDNRVPAPAAQPRLVAQLSD